MSTAVDLLTFIKSQGLVGATGALDDDAKILRYINRAYYKIYTKLAVRYASLYQTTQTVTVTNGSGTFSGAGFYIVLSVYDANNSFLRLKRVTVEETEREYPRQNDIGAPNRYDLVGLNGIATYPVNSTSLRVRGVPNANRITANSAEAEILIPVMHHDAIEWEALRMVAYDERDALVGAELQYTTAMADECLERLITYLDSQLPEAERRTDSYYS